MATIVVNKKEGFYKKQVWEDNVTVIQNSNVAPIDVNLNKTTDIATNTFSTIELKTSDWTKKGDYYTVDITHDFNSKFVIAVIYSNSNEEISSSTILIDKTKFTVETLEPVNGYLCFITDLI